MLNVNMSCPHCGSSYLGSNGSVSLSQRQHDGKFTLDCPGCGKQLPGYVEGGIMDGRIIPDPGFAIRKKAQCVAFGTRIRLPGGVQREVERKHRLFARGRWLAACELRAGDELAALDASSGLLQTRRVETVVDVDEPVPVFNLYVDDACTFISNGFVTHSYVVAPALRTKLNRLELRLERALETAFSPLPASR